MKVCVSCANIDGWSETLNGWFGAKYSKHYIFTVTVTLVSLPKPLFNK